MLFLENLLTRTGLCNKPQKDKYGKYQLVCIITWGGRHKAVMFNLGEGPLFPKQIIEYLDFANKLVSESFLGVRYNYEFFQCYTPEISAIENKLFIPVMRRFYKIYDGPRVRPWACYTWTYRDGKTAFIVNIPNILQVRLCQTLRHYTTI